VLKVLPKRAVEIVRASILAQPRLAPEIAAVAAGTLPDQSAEIIAAAVDAAPADLRSAIVAPTTGGAIPGGGDTGRAAAPSFPAQPVRPDLVSPSS